jgi:hypothetical protein
MSLCVSAGAPSPTCVRVRERERERERTNKCIAVGLSDSSNNSQVLSHSEISYALKVLTVVQLIKALGALRSKNRERESVL